MCKTEDRRRWGEGGGVEAFLADPWSPLWQWSGWESDVQPLAASIRPPPPLPLDLSAVAKWVHFVF